MEIPHIREIGKSKKEKKNALTKIRRSNAKTGTGHEEENANCFVKVDGRRNVDIAWITAFIRT